jgi:hypothetical protein
MKAALKNRISRLLDVSFVFCLGVISAFAYRDWTDQLAKTRMDRQAVAMSRAERQAGVSAAEFDALISRMKAEATSAKAVTITSAADAEAATQAVDRAVDRAVDGAIDDLLGSLDIPARMSPLTRTIRAFTDPGKTTWR